MQQCCNRVMARRQTPSKSAILTILKEAGGGALSHDMLQDELEKNVDRSTIYRVLNRFHQDGVLHKVVCDDGKQYFAYCTNCEQEKHHHNHFHFRCQNCGKVECLNEEIGIGLPKGYEAKTFNGIISGYCNDCQNRP